MSLYGVNPAKAGRLPTMLTLGVQAKAFFVISQIYFLDIL